MKLFLRVLLLAVPAVLLVGTLFFVNGVHAAPAPTSHSRPVKHVLHHKPSHAHWRKHITLFPTRQQMKHLHSGVVSYAVSGSGNLAWNGGSVQETPVSYVIFWGASWNNGAGGVTSDGQIALNYLNDMGGTPFGNILTQYYDSFTSVANTHHVAGVWLDGSTPPTDTSCGGPTVQDASIQSEVSNAIAANAWPTDGANAVYYVYTPNGDYINDGTGACSEQTFCAYHNYSATGVAYGAMAYPFVLNGCGVPQSPNGNSYGDSLASLTSHEQFEAITDPQPGSGWVDASGYEIGDKCAWDFSAGLTSLGAGTFEIQTEYSNATSSCINSY